MTDLSADMRKTGRTTFWIGLVIACLLVVVAANAHLVYVATISQPDCIAHVRQGEGSGELGRFAAAQSSCASPTASRPGPASGRE
jgi:hypothetical protein